MSQLDAVSFLPLGGIEDVTKNMYVYEYKNQILLVDCGIGFPNEATMPGVDLLLPDISYLLKTPNKILGMVLTHGHEDHIGALPFILPQLPQFPVYGTPLTAGLANEKLKEFGLAHRVKAIPFTSPTVRIGDFSATFIRVTHSVPDTSNIFIKTPIGNFYHGSDFKFDITPADGKRSDYQKIAKAGEFGTLCLMSDCLGAERPGYVPTEISIKDSFEREMKICKGKFIVTTYSSNISRINQAIEVAQGLNRRVCFIGRSLLKAKEVAQNLGYMRFPRQMEVTLDQVKKYKDQDLLLLVAGSQGQENSALTRIANGQHREIKIAKEDTIIFSSDAIPGNEISVNALVNTITKFGAKVLYSDVSRDFHVSGHGSAKELQLLMSLVSPKYVLPIGGNYKHMSAYRRLAQEVGYKSSDALLLQNGQRVIFTKDHAGLGEKIPIKNVYVDQISGEEVESFVLRDRQKLVDGGVVIVMVDIDGETGQLIGNAELIARGIAAFDDKTIGGSFNMQLKKALNKGKVNNWVFVRKLIGDIAEKVIFQELRVRPLVLPVVIEG